MGRAHALSEPNTPCPTGLDPVTAGQPKRHAKAIPAPTQKSIITLVIVHLNSQLIPIDQARISPLDRGFLMGDAIYEGLRAFRGLVRALPAHIERMSKGLAEARIPWDARALGPLTTELLAANATPDAFIYWQVSRGTPMPGTPVRQRLPQSGMPVTVFGYCAPQPPIEAYASPVETTAATRPDLRWQRGHIKSTSLMGNVMSVIEAGDIGANDAILVRDTPAGPFVSEASATNVVLALRKSGKPGTLDGIELVTPDLESTSILAGVTRRILISPSLPQNQGLPSLITRPVRAEELHHAEEIMLMGSTSMVTSVVRLDGRPIGDGHAGPIARWLLAQLVQSIRNDLGFEQLSPATPATVKA